MGTNIRSEVKTIAPSEAQVFVNENKFHLQRKVKPTHIAALVAAMKSGEFPIGTAIYFAQTPDALELIDGQHRLRAQIIAGISVEYTEVTITCKNKAEAEILYTQIDIGAKRSINDRMRALDLLAHINLKPKQASLFAAGAPYIKFKFGKMTPSQSSQMTPVQRLEVCKEYEQGAIKYFECMELAEDWCKEPFFRPHFVALGAFLFQHSPEHALHLWTSISENECGGNNDARKRMLNLVLNNKSTVVGAYKTQVVLQAFIQGWNAMVNEKKVTTNLIPAQSPSVKVKINGLDISFNNDTLEQLEQGDLLVQETEIQSAFIPSIGAQMSKRFPETSVQN